MDDRLVDEGRDLAEVQRLRLELAEENERRLLAEAHAEHLQERLVEEQQAHAATREELSHRSALEFSEPCADQLGQLVCTKPSGHDTHWNGRTAWRPDIAQMAADSEELERQRPVVDTARAAVVELGNKIPGGADWDERVAYRLGLGMVAVNALDAPPEGTP